MEWIKEFFRLTEEHYLTESGHIISIKDNTSIYIGENNNKYYLFDMISVYPKYYVFGPEEGKRKAISSLRNYFVDIGVIQENEKQKFIYNKRSHNVEKGSTNSGKYGIMIPNFERWITKEDVELIKKQFNVSDAEVRSGYTKEDYPRLDVIKKSSERHGVTTVKEKNTAENLLNNHWSDLIKSRPEYDTNFVPRPSMQKSFDEWADTKGRLLLISGNLGMGKTTFITQQINNGTIKKECTYFCRRLYPKTIKATSFLRSLIYAIYCNSNDYRNLLNKDEDCFNQLFGADTAEDMVANIVSSLHKVNDVDNFIFVIDALDEAFVNGKNSITKLLQNYIAEFPSWVRFICTTREIPEIIYRIKSVADRHISITDNDKEDTRQYYRERLHGENMTKYEFDRIIDTLVDKGDGSFLYAKLVCDELDDGKQSIYNLKLPEGLEGKYVQYLDGCIDGKHDFDKNIKPFLNVVCAYNGLLTLDMLSEMLCIDDEDEIREQFERIPSLFQISDFGEIIPIHINILEFFENGNCPNYRINVKAGHKMLSTFCKNHLSGTYADYYMITHMILSEKMYEDAEQMLLDSEYSYKRRRDMGLEEYIIKYLDELKLFNEIVKEKSYMEKIMNGDVFNNFISEHREFLYHHGLLYNLKDCGIDLMIYNNIEKWVEYQKSKNNNMLLAFWTVYFYRLHSPSKCKELILYMGDLNFIDDIFIRAEILNWLGVCYMKEMMFDDALNTFAKIEDLLGANKDFLDVEEVNKKLAFSAVNSGKILTLQQGDDWKNRSVNCFKQSVDILKKQAENAKTHSEKKIAELILAEYCATSASYIIWTEQSDNYNGEALAKELIDKAQKIYETYHNKDQWYIRFCFIKALFEGFNDHPKEAYRYLSEGKNLNPRPYEKAHILLVEAIIDYIYHSDVSDEKLLIEAKDNALEYQGFLEFEEINAVWSLLGNKVFNNPYSSKYNYPGEWINYFRDILTEARERRGEIENVCAAGKDFVYS